MSSSRGLSDYMNTISTLGSNVDNINNYIAQNNTEFFQDWRSKVQNDMAAVKAKADAAFHTAEGIGGAYMGAKAVKAAYTKWKGGKETPEDKGADNEGDGDEADQAEANDLAEDNGTAGDSVDGTPLDDTPNEGAGSSFTEAPSDNLPAPGESMELQDASEFGSGGDAAPLSETLNEPASVGTQAQSQILDADPEAGPGGLGDTLTGDTAGEVGADVGADVGGDLAASAGADVAGGAAAAAAGAGAEAGAGALAAGLGVAAEAIPVVGALAAIGFGLYELFHPHHDPPKPKPPPPPTSVTAAQSSLVLPSFDSVVDTPASAAAF